MSDGSHFVGKPNLLAWMTERLPFGNQVELFLRRKNVPRHKYSFFYLFGGLALFLFGVQAITGILLALYYVPTPENAHESVKDIMNEVSFGWVIRSIHSWGANFMVAVVLIHMFSTFFMKAYRKPRELMWFSGVVILFVVLGFAFTGYLLPWDTTAYFATQIGTEIPKSIPVIGELAVRILRGGEDVGAEALTRLFATHTVVLPVLGVFLMAFHVILQQFVGTSVPIGLQEQHHGVPFFPNHVYRDLITWSIVLIVLLGFAILVPWGLAEKADPYASAPAGIKPEWYFLPLYQTLRIVPTSVFSLNGEMLVNIFVMVGAILWIAVPILDNKASRGEKSPFFTWVGIVLLIYMLLMISLAYFN